MCMWKHHHAVKTNKHWWSLTWLGIAGCWQNKLYVFFSATSKSTAMFSKIIRWAWLGHRSSHFMLKQTFDLNRWTYKMVELAWQLWQSKKKNSVNNVSQEIGSWFARINHDIHGWNTCFKLYANKRHVTIIWKENGLLIEQINLKWVVQLLLLIFKHTRIKENRVDC